MTECFTLGEMTDSEQVSGTRFSTAKKESDSSWRDAMKFISVHSHDADSEIELFKNPRSVLSFDSMIAEPASLRFRQYQSLKANP